MGSDLHHPWIREEMLREAHEKQVAELREENRNLRTLADSRLRRLESLRAELRAALELECPQPSWPAVVHEAGVALRLAKDADTLLDALKEALAKLERSGTDVDFAWSCELRERLGLGER